MLILMFLYMFSVYRDRPVPHCLYHNDDAVLLGPLDDQTTETFRVFLKVCCILLFLAGDSNYWRGNFSVHVWAFIGVCAALSCM